MASSRKDIKRITDREIEKVNIASLADRPTSGSRYGVGDFNAKTLKERFDKFPALIKDRFNAVVDALTSADAPKYITLDGSIAGVDNLFDFLLLFCEKTAGEKNISDYIQALYTDIQNAQASSKTLQDIINDMASWIAKLKEESSVHSGKISDAEKRLDKNDERLEDIEDYINDMVTVENSNAYHVPVPKDSRSKANVLSVGGMTYKDGDTLKNAKTRAIKSKNSQLIPFPYASNSSTVDGVTFTIKEDGSVYVKGTPTKDGITFALGYNLKPKLNTSITVSDGLSDSDASKVWVVGRRSNSSGATIFLQSRRNNRTSKLVEGDNFDRIAIYVSGKDEPVDVTVYPMLNYGTEALLYEKQIEVDSITIPESVQNLEGYGLGLNDEYKNTANLEKKKYQRLVGEVDLGTLDWIDETHCFSANLPDIKPTASGDYQARKTGFLCAKYDPSSNVSYTTMDDKSILRREIKRIHIRDSAYTDVAAFKAAMAGVMLVYELADPQEIDISSLFTADNEIKVSENGYLEFENEDQYPVPSSVEWAIYSSHKVAFEHANTVGNPHRTTAAEVGAYSISEADAKFVLLEDGKVPSRMLPSYVDDSIEGYINDSGDFVVTERAPDGNLLPAKKSGKIYVDTKTNKTYRWSGSIYVEMASGPMILGETAETAYRGDRGKIAYEHSQTKGNPHGTTMDEILPVTASDNGKFLRVVDGKWSAVTIATAEGGSF